MNNEKMEAEFNEVKERALMLANKITEGINKSYATPDWVSVDELLYISARLQEISDSVNGEGEHAE
ncbi:MAG: hypothetical protein AB7F25_12375 [Deferribacterales bacterium]